jgi:hypothetical protein
VCEALLAAEGLDGLEWSGRADEGRFARTDTQLIAIVWDSARRRAGRDAVISTLGETLLLGIPTLVFTNGEVALELGNLDARGPGEILELLARHPRVVRDVPSLLGVRDLSGVHTRGSWDLAVACELARVFVPTRAYRHTLDVLERHHFAVLSGPPEMGKTAIARVLGLALHVEGWEVHECIRPEQIWQAFEPDHQQLFIADDAFGSTEYRPDAAEHWALDLPRILRALERRHKLVWTSRPAPLRAGLGRIQREHGVERFPRPAEVNVDASALDVEEKATILLRHAQAALLECPASELVRIYGTQIVDHPHFTPERIRRFVRVRLPELRAQETSPFRIETAIACEIAEPTEAMTASFAALAPEHRGLLVALVDCPPGAVRERDLAQAMRRHSPGGLSQPVKELVDRLTDHFVRLVPPDAVTWVHPSWRDLVIDEVVADADARRSFLERCSIEGALLALSRGGGRAGERMWPFLVADDDWDRLAQRLHELAPELADPDVSRLLASFEDAVRVAPERERDELAAIAQAALTSLISAWSSGRTYATVQALDRAYRLWNRLDLPEKDVTALVWDPPRGQRYQGDRTRHHSGSAAPVEWNDGEPDDIVGRILADLD